MFRNLRDNESSNESATAEKQLEFVKRNIEKTIFEWNRRHFCGGRTVALKNFILKELRPYYLEETRQWL